MSANRHSFPDEEKPMLDWTIQRLLIVAIKAGDARNVCSAAR